MKVSLESLCTLLTDGTHYTPPNIGEGFPFLTVVDMQPSGLNFETCSRISPAEFAEADRQNSAPKSGDVLFSKDGTVGKVHVVNGEGPFAVLSSIAIIRPDSDKLDPGYLAHFLRSPEAVSAADRSKTGSALRRIILKDIKRLSLNPPPLPEQRRIAGILDQADALRRLRRQSLSRLSALGQAIFYEMFGDPISNPKGWDKVELVECVASSDDIRCGPFGTQLLREEFQEDGVPLWGIKQVNRGFAIPTHEFVTEKKAKVLANYTIIPGDIVMTRKGTIGNCSVYPKEFPVGIMHSDLLRLRIDRNKCEPEFISDQLHFSPDIQHQIALISGGAIMQGINVGKLKKIRVLLPPKPLQDEYMRRVHAVQAKRESAIAHEVALDSLFASLQHRAFRGNCDG